MSYRIQLNSFLATELEATKASAINSTAFAAHLDSIDPLAHLREHFHVPLTAAVVPASAEGVSREARARECTYLAGNSLGLMPKSTPELVKQELDVWASSGVMGHHSHPHKRPWIEIDDIVTASLANLVGAKPSEVACMGTLTANLHSLLSSFYKPTATRHKILYEGKAFPSDQYAFASQVEANSFPPTSLLPMDPLPGEYNIRTSEILRVIEEEGESIAVICFGAVQYYSGQLFDMQTITKAGHAKGCLVAFDLAHAIGNVPIELHNWGVDFAMWCSYKYLCSGPGGIAGLYVHERWADRPRLAGWWGHELATRFAMPSNFIPAPGAAGFQLSNPSVLDVISLYSSLEVFKLAGAVGSSIPHEAIGEAPVGDQSTKRILNALREKSVNLTSYLETLLAASQFYQPVGSASTSPNTLSFTVITPKDPLARGAQLSLLFTPHSSMPTIFDFCAAQGVLGDERKPGVIRFAPVPMYNTFEDVRNCVRVLEEALESEQKRLA